MFEHRSEPPIPRRAFLLRMVRHGGIVAAVLAFSLLIGMAGYHSFEGLPWIDGFLNSAMLLGGMGPVDPLKTEGGKLFAGFYALYAGLVFITVASLLGAPIFHRLLHRFHWEEQEEDEDGPAKPGRRRRPAKK
jgi:hypothetical protein